MRLFSGHLFLYVWFTSMSQEAADKTMDVVQALSRPDNLVHMMINPMNGQFRGGTLTMGARADSYYEYLLKQWLQTSKTEEKWATLVFGVDGELDVRCLSCLVVNFVLQTCWVMYTNDTTLIAMCLYVCPPACVSVPRFRSWYLASMEGVEKRLMRRSSPGRLLFVGEERQGGQYYPKMVRILRAMPLSPAQELQQAAESMRKIVNNIEWVDGHPTTSCFQCNSVPTSWDGRAVWFTCYSSAPSYQFSLCPSLSFSSKPDHPTFAEL